MSDDIEEELESFCKQKEQERNKNVTTNKKGELKGEKTMASMFSNSNANKNGANMFGIEGLTFGVYANENVKLSMKGMAVKADSGKYVAYHNGASTDVSSFLLDFDGAIYAMPVAISKIKIGDVVLHNGKPVHVQEVCYSGEGDDRKPNGKLTAIDLTTSTEVTIIPVKNVFNFDFYTKLTSLFKGLDGKDANEDNPFGISPVMLMMMSSTEGGNGMDMNALLPLMLLSDKGKGKDGEDDKMLKAFMMMSMMNNKGVGDAGMNPMAMMMMMMGDNVFEDLF